MKLMPAALFQILFSACLLLSLPACKTTEDEKLAKERAKERTLLSVHLEADPYSGRPSMPITVLRSQPIQFHVDPQPFLDITHVDQAAVVPAPGGYAIKIQLNRQGTWLLENYTTSNNSKVLAIHAAWKGESRWLAVKEIKDRIGNGQLVFPADATMEEAERIVRGLNNAADEIRKKNKI